MVKAEIENIPCVFVIGAIQYNNHRTEIMLSRRKTVVKMISTGKLFTNFHGTKFLDNVS